jgi:uncharacterized Rmd1/YagE family protein
VALFRFGAAVFVGPNPVEEEGIIKGLDGRLVEPLIERESETVQITLKPDGEDQPFANGSRSTTPHPNDPSSLLRR